MENDQYKAILDTLFEEMQAQNKTNSSTPNNEEKTTEE
jgi:hypothetical protein